MNETIYRYRVSDLAQAAYCTKRAKIQAFKTPDYSPGSKNEAARMGTFLHDIYSPYMHYEWFLLRSKIFMKYGPTLTRRFDDIEIAGRFDELRVLHDLSSGQTIVPVLEIKTTPKRFIWNFQVDAAILQLQIYIWLLEPVLKDLGYNLHSRHYVEVYSQVTRKLMKRIIVKKDPLMQKRIYGIICAWMGLERMKYPELKICKQCPRSIKGQCERWVSIYGEHSRLLH